MVQAAAPRLVGATTVAMYCYETLAVACAIFDSAVLNLHRMPHVLVHNKNVNFALLCYRCIYASYLLR